MNDLIGFFCSITVKGTDTYGGPFMESPEKKLKSNREIVFIVGPRNETPAAGLLIACVHTELQILLF